MTDYVEDEIIEVNGSDKCAWHSENLVCLPMGDEALIFNMDGRLALLPNGRDQIYRVELLKEKAFAALGLAIRLWSIPQTRDLLAFEMGPNGDPLHEKTSVKVWSADYATAAYNTMLVQLADACERKAAAFDKMKRVRLAALLENNAGDAQ